ncbi:CpsB/CapC family capsule biosynthesis tyrosine phosphatase [Mucisphaera calidilacus]|uniref:protein-tyrosine-phosphatase n=1 Tax=Mucisphaera calidilacus TaxID=2527982 RepID=A0A518BWF5_9BACT|nr:CpsB/CapC family capsule biosynthesis tyrosine phosphatase [Mucisphaera calidilacus]QDU71313.1 Tyrosine-protein phosphatase CpsB [Mucisphaera calidilacus]
MSDATPTPTTEPPLPATGRLDLHAHLIPDVDDGSRSYDETVALVQRLKRADYSGSVCTPHVWPELFPDNTPAKIADLTAGLRGHLADNGIDYTLWDGGELRLFEGVTAWLKANGVPTLGPSRAVLCDFWEAEWPTFVDEAFEWMLSEGYQPLLAHPERIPMTEGLEAELDRVQALGVMLQGNLRCLTDEESPLSRLRARAYLQDGRYSVMALDVHRADSLDSRIDGLGLGAELVGAELIDELTMAAPRKLLQIA